MMRHQDRPGLFNACAAALIILCAGLFTARAGYAQGITNGGFEDGLTGWTMTLHTAWGPGGVVPIQAGGQVLSGADFWRNGVVNPGLSAPEGTHFALVSSTPGGGPDVPNPAACPVSQSIDSGVDLDGDGHNEMDVTTLSQDFTVAALPAQFSFMWSFLNNETATQRHDDFSAVLTPINANPYIGSITLKKVTAGNPGFASTFAFIPLASFDGSSYEVITNPTGGAADCFYTFMGRTQFQAASVALPNAGDWRITFFFGDDGGDARWDGGVLIDAVRVTAPPVGTGMCPAQPRGDCATETTPTKDKLKIKAKTGANSMKWKWGAGPNDPVWGNPVALDTYQLCQYDPLGLLQASGVIPFGGGWKTSGKTGYKYKDANGSISGITRLKVKGSTTYGKSKISLKANGPNLPPPALPLVTPTTIQLMNSTGACFSSTFTNPTANETTKFRSKSD